MIQSSSINFEKVTMNDLETLMGETSIDKDNFSSMTEGYGEVKKKCFADMGIPLPPIIRDKGKFSGLKNQGATCYLNCLF